VPVLSNITQFLAQVSTGRAKNEELRSKGEGQRAGNESSTWQLNKKRDSQKISNGKNIKIYRAFKNGDRETLVVSNLR
jgi:hypothetical protein